MAKKIKDNIYLLAALLSGSLFFAALLLINKAGRFPIAAAAIVITAIFFRIVKVARKDFLQYLNGPKRFCKGKGIEIGSGAHRMLQGSLLVDMIDDFSSAKPYKVDYVTDAHTLSQIASGSLDYVCASHVLEHLTDPIKAILEWLRVLKPGGILWLRIPDKRKTFDRTRERTKLAHLVDDFRNNVPVDDPAHINDNNLNTDPPRNEAHPYIHNHVWISEDIGELFGYIKEKYVALAMVRSAENTCKNAEDFWIVVKKA